MAPSPLPAPFNSPPALSQCLQFHPNVSQFHSSRLSLPHLSTPPPPSAPIPTLSPHPTAPRCPAPPRPRPSLPLPGPEEAGDALTDSSPAPLTQSPFRAGGPSSLHFPPIGRAPSPASSPSPHPIAGRWRGVAGREGRGRRRGRGMEERPRRR